MAKASKEQMARTEQLVADLDAQVSKLQADLDAQVSKLQANMAAMSARPAWQATEAVTSTGGRTSASRSADMSYKMTFKVSGLPDGKQQGQALAELVESFVLEKMKVGIKVVDAYRLGKPDAEQQQPRRIMFRVGTVWEADSIVKNRPKLKASGTVIMDELSPAEYVIFKQLWPQFKAARDEGKVAYFNRARLYISGVEVMLP